MRLWYKYFAPMLVLNLVRKPNSNLNFGAFLKYLPLEGGWVGVQREGVGWAAAV